MQQRNPELHRGHRERVKTRFLQEGLEHFEDYEIFELLLFYGVPQKDVNELAHELVNKFGSYSGVLDASYTELMQVNGIGSHTATLICLCKQMAIRYLREAGGSRHPMIARSAMFEFLEPLFLNAREEKMVLMSLDAQYYLINHTVMATGDLDRVSISTRNIVHQALNDNACYVVMAHNHPGGSGTPSGADIERTLEVVKALGVVGIQVDTHLIFGARKDYYDMATDPEYSYVFKTSWGALK